MKALSLVRALTRTRTQIRRARTFSPSRSLCSSPPPQPGAGVALKNVTKLNFESALDELRHHVSLADFVAIDLEMTGITSAPWRECFEFDRPDIQYLKIKDSAEKFAVVQFGVCPFRWDPEIKSFVAYPHNFYIFPRQEIPGDQISSEFLCQTSSLEFLAKYQFDFNTCIYEGISYLSRSQEAEALGRLDSQYKDFPGSSSKLRDSEDTKFSGMADILFAERMKNELSKWRAGLLREGKQGSEIQGNLIGMNQKFQTTFFHSWPALKMNGLTSRQLELIKLVTGKHFTDLAYVHVTHETSGPQPLIVYTDSTADRDLLMREVQGCQRKEAETKIKAAVGFRHVVDLLSSERKLIVGHNCFLDLAHVYSKFIGPLPSTAEEFVSGLQAYFPHIIDTKLLLNSDNELLRITRRGSTSLSKVFSLLCPPIAHGSTSNIDKCVKVEVQVEDQRFPNWNSGAKHEAGYDAFMTGCVFSQSCFHIGIDFKLCTSTIDLLHNEKLQKYINLLYLSWVNGDIIDLRTGKIATETFSPNAVKHLGHPKIVHSNMVLLWKLPRELRTKDIKDCFSKAFGNGAVTSIYHLDESAIFVQFSKPELVVSFLELKRTLESGNSLISVVHPLSNILRGGNMHTGRYEVYKEICSSPATELVFANQAEAVRIESKTIQEEGDEKTVSGTSFGDDVQIVADEYVSSCCPSEARVMNK